MSKGTYNGYSNVMTETSPRDISFIDEVSRASPKLLPSPASTSKRCEKYQEYPVARYIFKVIQLFSILRCRFTPELSKFSLFINHSLFFSIFVVLIGMSIFVLSIISTYSLETKSLPAALMRVTFYFQGAVSMGFIYYWQKLSPSLIYLKKLHASQNSAGCLQGQNRLFRLVVCLYLSLAFIILYLFCLHLFMVFDFNIDLYDRNMLEIFRKNKGIAFFSFFINAYSSFCVSAGFFIYSVFTYAAVLEVDYYNQRLQNIGHESTEIPLLEELIILINDHAKLSEAIRTLDSFCEVYAFIMIGCTVPTTVFTLLQLLISKDLPLINLLLTLPVLIICILQLTALTAIPAMLYNTLERSKHFLYSNIKVWKQFDRNIYQVSSSLAAHLSQTDLGISVWGFAVVSKPLILTTISVMVTCIAFFLELRRRPSSSAYSSSVA